ncbi:2Fe-2S iron-sulfur cluster-binding protein [Streptomyces sp. ACA25]|uniref:2Fe-2S iron-sulfur cluster-binding protein n=1 Tax=Streptomyces sp. ACA25 TaxID=3022596 RepID=UPI002307575B|nr:2Fe-2S iron-sulfur cluster-binding protein [Streptomyces sp. ACA25]MDB1089496.1 2Fe-2S iron-sulfur cluster-binding protein [Streptomyces sp. ACA25]
MSNDQQPYVPPPRAGWGGEHDPDTTAFLQLPQPDRPGDPDGDPLAAPGHGYRPPVIGEAAGPLVTSRPSTDPAAPGSWTMPFATGGSPAPSDEPVPDTAGRREDTGFPLAAGSPPVGEDTAGSGPPGVAAMGQGAAAALAGSLEGRARTRPHGAGEETASWQEDVRPGGHEQPEAAGHAPWLPEPDPAGLPESPAPARQAGPGTASDHPLASYVLRVNGAERPVTDAWIGESLLHVLRERLGLAGAKDGCSQGECGACSVQVDGRLLAACLVPAATAAGCEIRTVEGLGTDGVPSDVQRALARTDVQCGFCLPGMAMTVHDLLEGNHRPTELETRQALCGNLCRCSGYRGVLEAVAAVAEERAGRAEEPVGSDRGEGPAGRGDEA